MDHVSPQQVISRLLQYQQVLVAIVLSMGMPRTFVNGFTGKYIREWIDHRLLYQDEHVYERVIVQLHYIAIRLSLMKLPKIDFEYNYQLMNCCD